MSLYLLTEETSEFSLIKALISSGIPEQWEIGIKPPDSHHNNLPTEQTVPEL